MSVSRDIVRTYLAPREVMRRRIGDTVREDRALVILYVGCLLVFVSQLPRLSREAYLDPSIPYDARVSGALWAWIIFVPLAFYAIAAVAHIIARLFGGRGTWFTARMGLFWAFLASSPLWLLNGLVQAFMGQGAEATFVSGLCLAVFLVFSVVGLREAEFGPATPAQ